MDTIKALITNATNQAQTNLMPALLIGALVVGGILFMIGDHRGGRSWITNGLIGAAIITGATGIAALVH